MAAWYFSMTCLAQSIPVTNHEAVFQLERIWANVLGDPELMKDWRSNQGDFGKSSSSPPKDGHLYPILGEVLH